MDGVAFASGCALLASFAIGCGMSEDSGAPVRGHEDSHVSPGAADQSVDLIGAEEAISRAGKRLASATESLSIETRDAGARSAYSMLEEALKGLSPETELYWQARWQSVYCCAYMQTGDSPDIHAILDELVGADPQKVPLYTLIDVGRVLVANGRSVDARRVLSVQLPKIGVAGVEVQSILEWIVPEK